MEIKFEWMKHKMAKYWDYITALQFHMVPITKYSISEVYGVIIVQGTPATLMVYSLRKSLLFVVVVKSIFAANTPHKWTENASELLMIFKCCYIFHKITCMYWAFCCRWKSTGGKSFLKYSSLSSIFDFSQGGQYFDLLILLTSCLKCVLLF